MPDSHFLTDFFFAPVFFLEAPFFFADLTGGLVTLAAAPPFCAASTITLACLGVISLSVPFDSPEAAPADLTYS